MKKSELEARIKELEAELELHQAAVRDILGVVFGEMPPDTYTSIDDLVRWMEGLRTENKRLWDTIKTMHSTAAVELQRIEVLHRKSKEQWERDTGQKVS